MVTLPPLVVDSDMARVLYRVWSGERLVVRSDVVQPSQQKALMVGLASHMCIRAGYEVLVVTDGRNVPSAVQALLPAGFQPGQVTTTEIDLTHFGPRVIVKDVDRIRMTDAVYDLAILYGLSGDLPGGSLLSLLMCGVQYCVLGPTSDLRYLEGPDRQEAADVPVDVALAGGVE